MAYPDRSTSPAGTHRGGGGGSLVVRPVLRVVGVLVSVGLLLASGYFWLTYRNLDSGLTRLGGVRVGEQGGGAQNVDRKDQNILIVGNDDRSNMTRGEQEDLHVGPGDGSRATDTMMIVHVPADGSRATLLSLPRDSYVDIPGHGRGKLNSAYVMAYDDAKGDRKARITAGANTLIKTISNLTGLTIDRYAQIGLLGFYRIAVALKGVQVTMCADVRDPKSGFHATKGQHRLNGRQSLQFVRQRYNFPDGQGDLDRVRRQQYFLTAAFRRIASVGVLGELRDLGNALKTSLFLDSGFDVIDLARQVEGLTANNIRGATIPTEFATIDGQDVLRVEPAKVQRFVTSLITPTGDASAKPTSSAASTAPAAPSTATATATASKPAKAPDTRCTY